MVRESYEQQPFTSIDASTAAAPITGDEVGFPPRPGRGFPRNFTWTTDVVGGPSIIDADLEGAIDDPDVDANWFVVDTAAATVDEVRHVVDKVVRHLRVKLKTRTGGTSFGATILADG